MFPPSICLVDDDHDFVSFLTRYLESHGCAVSAFDSAEAFFADPAAMGSAFFLVDLSLPGADGIDLVSLIRANSDAGIIVISGRMGPDAFSAALASGADIFVNKPVRFDQVYQAIMSVSRRLGVKRHPKGLWTFDDVSALLVSPFGNSVKLTALEHKILDRLLAASGSGVDRSDLAKWADVAPSKDDRNLDAAVFRMRRRIEQQCREAAPIRTVHGSGYAVVDVIRKTDTE